MARIRKSDERLEAEFSHEAAWDEEPHLDLACPSCDDILMLPEDRDGLTYCCPACGYREGARDV